MKCGIVFVYTYFDLHLMSEQETDRVKKWLRKYFLVCYAAADLVIWTAELQRLILITLTFIGCLPNPNTDATCSKKRMIVLHGSLLVKSDFLQPVNAIR